MGFLWSWMLGSVAIGLNLMMDVGWYVLDLELYSELNLANSFLPFLAKNTLAYITPNF